MPTLQIDNPHSLPTIPYTELRDFQGDLKKPLDEEALAKLKSSLTSYGQFVPKFVWRDEEGSPLILDGHQTCAALRSLEQEGWTIPPIVYVEVRAKDRQDAAAKLLQLNSRYADWNPETTFFSGMGMSEDEVQAIIESTRIPDLNIDELLAPVTFQVPDQPNAPGGIDYGRLSRTQDSGLRPDPLPPLDAEDDSLQSERLIIVFKGEAERTWLERCFGVPFRTNRIIYPVQELQRMADEVAGRGAGTQHGSGNE
jgi:hypothetical protein